MSKLIFDKKDKVVWLQLSQDEAATFKFKIEDLQATKNFFEKLVKDNTIGEYILRHQEILSDLAQMKFHPKRKDFLFALGAGGWDFSVSLSLDEIKKIKGIKFSLEKDFLDLHPTLPWFLAKINQKVNKSFSEKIFEEELVQVYKQIISAETFISNEYFIPYKKYIIAHFNNDPYFIYQNVLSGSLTLLFHDPSLLTEGDKIYQLKDLVQHYISEKKEQNDFGYIYDESFFDARLEEFSTQNEYYNSFYCYSINLCYSQKSLKVNFSQKVTSAKASDSLFSLMLEKSDWFEIDVSSDGMEAWIINFKNDLYLDSSFNPSYEDFKKQIKKTGISYTSNKKLLENAYRLLSERKDLSNTLVATGKKPISGQGIILEKHFEDKASNEKINWSQDLEWENIYSFNKKYSRITKKGSVIAEIKFKTPAQSGKDVFNSEVLASSRISMPFTCGTGVAYHNLKYIATMDGALEVGQQLLTIRKNLDILSSVTMKDGIIDYEGDVTINGDIEAGSRIKVKGNLTVNGKVYAAYIQVSGNLLVRDGIIMERSMEKDHRGFIDVRGNVFSSIIDKAYIKVKGDINCSKMIINSFIYCDGITKVGGAHAGLIAGGVLSSSKGIKCFDFGFEIGESSTAILGQRSAVIFRMQLLEERIKKLKEIRENIRSENRNLARDKQEEKLKFMNDKLQRIAHIISRLVSSFEELKKEIKPPRNVRMNIKSKSMKNAKIISGEKTITELNYRYYLDELDTAQP